MKLLTIINKNLKLLFRAKSSAFIVVFGPLLIILLVGLALNKPSTYDLSVGVYAPEYNDLTRSFVEELQNNNYLVEIFDNNITCIDAIKKATVHTCIVFPGNFIIRSQGSNQVIFYVDYSRANLVYQIIESISSNIDIRSSELSYELTNNILSRMTETASDVDANILALITLKASTDNIVANIGTIQSNIDSIDLDMEDTRIDDIETKVGETKIKAKSLKGLGYEAVGEGLDLASNSSTGDLLSIKQELNTTYNQTLAKYSELEIILENATDIIDDIEDKLKNAKSSNINIKKSLDETKASLNTVKSETDTVKSSLETINSNIAGIEVKSAESIVSPITTKIEPVVPESTQLGFMFPFLLVLVIMFIGIMLSSALIVMEKNSKSSFRNFTTPTKDEFFVISTYLTSLALLILQIVIILGISYFFIKSSLISNLGIASLVLFITISTFIILGMIIGYLSSTQEAATMLSIAIGSILLLLSNLILPLETMSTLIQKLARFNPYVLSSELLKKTLLFNVSFREAGMDILFLTIIMIVLFVIMFLVQKLSKIKYLQKIPHIKRKELIYVPEDSYLKLENHAIKNLHGVLTVLKNMHDEEFNKYVNKKKNDICDWISTILRERKLAWKLRSKSREQMISILDAHLKKIEKKEEKKRTKLLKKEQKDQLSK